MSNEAFDFQDFGKPAPDSGPAGSVVCLQCRHSVEKNSCQFSDREVGYLCGACQTQRRRAFLAKVGSVAAGTVAAIAFVIFRVLRAIRGRDR